MSSPTTSPCPGCAAILPEVDGPTHAYIGASPACWKIYGDILAREYHELANPPWHRLTVDAYAAQHPGVPSRRSIQSVGVHLIALHLVLDRGLAPETVTKRLGAAVSRAGALTWLDPPSFAGTPTAGTVAAAITPTDHENAVWDWARAIWAAWSPHHAQVIEWVGGL